MIEGLWAELIFDHGSTVWPYAESGSPRYSRLSRLLRVPASGRDGS